jgi:hypothetical protein
LSKKPPNQVGGFFMSRSQSKAGKSGETMLYPDTLQDGVLLEMQSNTSPWTELF